MSDVNINLSSADQLAYSLGNKRSSFQGKKSVWIGNLNNFSEQYKVSINKLKTFNDSLSEKKIAADAALTAISQKISSIESTPIQAMAVLPGADALAEAKMDDLVAEKQFIEKFIERSTRFIKENTDRISKIEKKILVIASVKNKLVEISRDYDQFYNLNTIVREFVSRLKAHEGASVSKISETDYSLLAVAVSAGLGNGGAFMARYNKNALGIPTRREQQFLEVNKGDNSPTIQAHQVGPGEEWKIGKKVKDVGLISLGVASSFDKKPVYLDSVHAPKFANIFLQARERKVDLTFGSNYRSNTEQFAARAYNDCDPDPTAPSSTCSPKTAPVGQSEHESGEAVDFADSRGQVITPGSPQFRFLSEVAPKQGIKNFPDESWHWSTTGG